jgi:tetratricopeptide (TPR) repeat protein
MCQEKLKDYKQSLLSFKKCLTLDTSHFGACIHVANLLANLGEGQRAAKYFKHAIEIDPDNLNAHFGLAKAIQQYSDDKQAPIQHFDEVLKREPDHYKALT